MRFNTELTGSRSSDSNRLFIENQKLKATLIEIEEHLEHMKDEVFNGNLFREQRDELEARLREEKERAERSELSLINSNRVLEDKKEEIQVLKNSLKDCHDSKDRAECLSEEFKKFKSHHRAEQEDNEKDAQCREMQISMLEEAVERMLKERAHPFDSLEREPRISGFPKNQSVGSSNGDSRSCRCFLHEKHNLEKY